MPQVVENNRNWRQRMEPLETDRPRPRQVRYQAALRPDMFLEFKNYRTISPIRPLGTAPECPVRPLKPHGGWCKSGGSDGGSPLHCGGWRNGVETPWRHLVSRKVIDGRRYERSTGFSDLKAARRRAAEIEVELRSGALRWTTACPTFADWRKTYERTHAPSKRPRTQVRDEAPSRTPCHISGPSVSMRFGHRTVSSICTSVGRP